MLSRSCHPRAAGFRRRRHLARRGSASVRPTSSRARLVRLRGGECFARQSPDYACAYDILRAQFIRFPRMSSALAAFERETRASSVDDNDSDVTALTMGAAWDFILLATISSTLLMIIPRGTQSRDWVPRRGVWRRKISTTVYRHGSASEGGGHLFEVCVRRIRAARVTISVLPALVKHRPACRPVVLRMCASGFARDDARGIGRRFWILSRSNGKT